ncbi:hypothetical protein [Actibacterium ureilyticum]|uniref:hypothetical protein n=1 Tax=Actibacterium ureilyticum TaxID=1590614 RepID=UPI000BAAFA51|nr:hypothetical protein [Actibacterium ureilyticum]
MRFLLAGLLTAWAGAASADIQPRSGQWAGEYHFVNAVGCPAQMVAQMQAAPPQMRNYSTRIDFPDPFDPAAFQNNDVNFVWHKLGPDQWAASHSQAQETGMGQIITVSNFTLHVLSETEMRQDAELIATFPPALSQMMGMAGSGCVARSVVQHRYQAP